MKKLIAISLLFVSVTTMGAECANSRLKSVGFRIERASQFINNVQRVKSRLRFDESHFVLDIESQMWSRALGEYVLLTSYDDVRTSEDEMFGDVVIIRNYWTRKIVEVRWYQSGRRYLSYDSSVQECATGSIPLVVNALF